MAASCSLRVKGSWRRIEQAQQATIGARKVITVASERGRYSRESLGGLLTTVHITDLNFASSLLTVHPVYTKKATNTTKD